MLCAAESFSRAAKIFLLPRIQTTQGPHLIFRSNVNFEGTKMTKLSSITAAFVLFAPIAIAIISQAARIVA